MDFVAKPRCGAPRDLRAGVSACRRGTRTGPGAPMGSKTPCPRLGAPGSPRRHGDWRVARSCRRCVRFLPSSSSLSAPPPNKSTSMPLNGTSHPARGVDIREQLSVPEQSIDEPLHRHGGSASSRRGLFPARPDELGGPRPGRLVAWRGAGIRDIATMLRGTRVSMSPW